MTETEEETRWTRKQEAELAYNFDHDSDLWLVFFSEYIASGGEKSQELIDGIRLNTEEWKSTVARYKSSGFSDLKMLAAQKIAQWNVRVAQLLSDADHRKILRFYLRSLVALRTKRVIDVGIRAEARKQINQIISSVANTAYASLEKYTRAVEILASGKTESGKNLTRGVKFFYSLMQAESCKYVSALLAIILMFKSATGHEDIEKLRVFIMENLIRPLEASLKSSKMDADTEQHTRERIESYYRLYESVDINFG